LLVNYIAPYSSNLQTFHISARYSNDNSQVHFFSGENVNNKETLKKMNSGDNLIIPEQSWYDMDSMEG
jgi:hypothetical protein